MHSGFAIKKISQKIHEFFKFGATFDIKYLIFIDLYFYTSKQTDLNYVKLCISFQSI